MFKNLSPLTKILFIITISLFIGNIYYSYDSGKPIEIIKYSDLNQKNTEITLEEFSIIRAYSNKSEKSKEIYNLIIQDRVITREEFENYKEYFK